jgi:glutamyl-Q tRNA(Asp) synthetase
MSHYVGRFAPSPTGPLHFGSLLAALASWLDARAAGGRWLLRIEDLDKPREQPGAVDAILAQLDAFGLHWDGPVVYQSARSGLYRAALERLERAGMTYWCGCSRREIADSALTYGSAGGPVLSPDGARVYPGTCRQGLRQGSKPRAIRVRTGPEPVRFADRLQGAIEQSVEREVGDFILQRADGVVAYQLAVVVDDAEQGVTDVVRGDDLLDSTARQIHLQRLLGVPLPRYLHIPVAVTASGDKLSKQTQAPNADPADLARALAFLGMRPPRELAPRELLGWALGGWNATRIPRRCALPVPG